MTEQSEMKEHHKTKLRRYGVRAGLFASVALVAVYLVLALFIRTPTAAHLAARFLGDYLHSPVTVSGLGLAGGTFSIDGLTIADPPGFKERYLLTCRRVEITPSWTALLKGGKSFRQISVAGLRVSLDKNDRGEWNFGELVRRFRGQKGGGGETFVQRLAVTDSSLAVEGALLGNISLAVSEFSTKGTTGSKLLLSFRDAGGTLVRLEGGARLGPQPSLDLMLTAAADSLKNYREIAGKLPGVDLSKGAGLLSLKLNLHDGKVAAAVKLEVDHVVLATGRGAVPLKAALDITGGYDAGADTATLDACTLRVDDAIAMHASGKMLNVRKGREFAAEVSLDDTDLGALIAQLPPALRSGIAASGRLTSDGFRVSGNGADGITRGNGRLRLVRSDLALKGKYLFRGLAAEASLAKRGPGWEVSGRVSQETGAADTLLQDIEARFRAAFSNRMMPLTAEMPVFSASISGIPVRGKFSFSPGRAEPLEASLTGENLPAARLNPFLGGEKAALSAGTVSLVLRLSGRGAADFRGNLRGAVANIQGSAAGKLYAIREATAVADFGARAGKLSAAGKIGCSGASISGKPFECATAFSVRERELLLSEGTLTYDLMRIRFSGIRGPLPVTRRDGEYRRIPLRVHLEGVSGERGDVRIGGLTGDLGADLVDGRGRRWLEGGGSFTVSSLAVRKSEPGALAGRMKFAEGEMAVTMDGRLLGGTMRMSAKLDPFDAKKRATFSLDLSGLQGAALGTLMPEAQAVRSVGGTVDARLTGSYASTGGVECRLEAKGRGIVLAGKGGRTLLADGGGRTVIDLSKGDLTIREGLFSSGDGPPLQVGGSVARLLSADREGEIAFSLPESPLDSLLASYGSSLSVRSREISASGKAGMKGTVRISRGEAVLDGSVSLAQAGLEIPGQKFSASDISGTIPISLVIAAPAKGEKPQKRTYPSQTYADLLSSLRRSAQTSHNFTIGRIRFSSLEFGPTTAVIRAKDGLIELYSLKSDVLAGTVLGQGYFRYGSTIQYGGELALDNLSLRALCDAIPKIKGYISGKVNGIINSYGEGPGLNGLVGIVSIWAVKGPDEKMLVSKEFLQKLAGKKLKGIFVHDDRSYDRGEISGYLEKGYLVFDVLDISHTNLFGIRDLSVTVAPVQNKIQIEHLFSSIKAAAARGKAVGGGEEGAAPAPVETEFKWEE